MMTDNDYQHFVCIVAGDNPEKLMEEYNSNLIIEPYIVYHYKDVDKIKTSYIDEYFKILEKSSSNTEKNYINEVIQELNEMNNDEFFESLCGENMYFDDETGDIKSKKNKKGRWSYYNLGKAFSIPFLTKDGREIFQAYKKDIDWDKIHLSGKRVYERVWEMVMENDKPNDDHENILFENMKDKKYYLEKFENKENYVVSNTAFWGYAFLSENTGWMDASEVDDQFTWMSNFYNIFIKNLSDDVKLTIFECKK